VELAYARFRESPEAAEESLGELLEVMKEGHIDPQILVYAAEINHRLGNREAAKEYFLQSCYLPDELGN
jgi:hypothetical protein